MVITLDLKMFKVNHANVLKWHIRILDLFLFHHSKNVILAMTGPGRKSFIKLYNKFVGGVIKLGQICLYVF